VPGIPQVYYVGLLAGNNQIPHPDADPREINRRSYSESQVVEALRQPVVRELCRLIRLRGSHPAFRGTFEVHNTRAGLLGMSWRGGGARADLRVDLARMSYELKTGADRAREAAGG
jgi:sucrose phosphorylase